MNEYGDIECDHSLVWVLYSEEVIISICSLCEALQINKGGAFDPDYVNAFHTEQKIPYKYITEEYLKYENLPTPDHENHGTKTIRHATQRKKSKKRIYLKPWQDPESLFCDTEFLKTIIGKEPAKGKECKDES